MHMNEGEQNFLKQTAHEALLNNLVRKIDQLLNDQLTAFEGSKLVDEIQNELEKQSVSLDDLQLEEKDWVDMQMKSEKMWIDELFAIAHNEEVFGEWLHRPVHDGLAVTINAWHNEFSRHMTGNSIDWNEFYEKIATHNISPEVYREVLVQLARRLSEAHQATLTEKLSVPVTKDSKTIGMYLDAIFATVGRAEYQISFSLEELGFASLEDLRALEKQVREYDVAVRKIHDSE